MTLSIRCCTVLSEWRESGSYCPRDSRLICMNSGAGRATVKMKVMESGARVLKVSALSALIAACVLHC